MRHLLFAIAMLAACQVQAEGVRFITPNDGDVLTNPVHLQMQVEGMQVAPAGKLIPGSGHFHLLIDRGPIPKGEVIPKDEHHIHFGKGQTKATITLAPGTHRLTLQFADGAHRSYGEHWAQTITVHVQK